MKEVSQKLRLRPSEEEQKRLVKRFTENSEAYDLYIKGRYCWSRRSAESLKRAVEYFEQAIEKDPRYALPYAGLADCYIIYGGYGVESPRQAGPKALAAATRALQIDDTLAEAHASRGLVRELYEWDLDGAAREFERSIELDPKYATAHQWYGEFLSAQGRYDEAVASLKRALQLDPASLVINTGVGSQLHLAHRYDEAIEQVRNALKMDATFARGHWTLGQSYEQKENYSEAISELEKALELSQGSPQCLGALGHAYAVAGMRQKALRTLSDLRQMSKTRYVSPFEAGLVFIALGERERAFDALERAYEDRAWAMIWLKVDPRLDPLRDDPRFVNLLQRIGLRQ